GGCGLAIQSPLQRAGPEHEVHDVEERIDADVAEQHGAEKMRPRNAHQMQIRIDVTPVGAPAQHVEASVRVYDTPERPGILLSQAGVKSRLLHPPSVCCGTG